MTTIITSEEDLFNLSIGQRAVLRCYCEEVEEDGLMLVFQDWSKVFVDFDRKRADIHDEFFSLAYPLLDEEIEIMVRIDDLGPMVERSDIRAALRKIKGHEENSDRDGHAHPV